MNIYKFSVPVQISYCIDESNVVIESMKDIKRLQKKYDVDLDFIIDEFDYKVSINDDNSEEDSEYLNITKDEIFDEVILDKWDDILNALNIDYSLNDLDHKIVEKIFKIVSDNFNNSNLGKLFSIPVKITMVNFNIDESIFLLDVESDKELDEKEIEDIRKYIDGQCSDGWGEGFEQQDISHEINEDERYVYVKTWLFNNEVKYIK